MWGIGGERSVAIRRSGSFLSKEFSGVTAENVRAKLAVVSSFLEAVHRSFIVVVLVVATDAGSLHERRVNDGGRDGQSIDCRQATRALYIYRS